MCNFIWPMRIQSQLSGNELSNGSSLARVGRLGSENNIYLSHVILSCPVQAATKQCNGSVSETLL